MKAPRVRRMSSSVFRITCRTMPLIRVLTLETNNKKSKRRSIKIILSKMREKTTKKTSSPRHHLRSWRIKRRLKMKNSRMCRPKVERSAKSANPTIRGPTTLTTEVALVSTVDEATTEAVTLEVISEESLSEEATTGKIDVAATIRIEAPSKEVKERVLSVNKLMIRIPTTTSA